MMFRIVLGAVLVVGAAGGWFIAAGPSIVLGSIKDDYVAGAESAGIDMSECKARQKTILDPSGGMAMCAQDVYREVQRQVSEIENADSESTSSDEAPLADEQAETSSEE
jgi:hypothetical protein